MRTIVVSALTLLPCVVAYAVDGFNMPGGDYNNFNADSPSVCRDSCGGDARCQGWTWVKPGIQGASGHCWLKSTQPKLVKDDCCSSGPRNFISQSEMKAEENTDRPGLDYTHFVSTSSAACQESCMRDPRCAAWSYALPGLQGPQGQCWLKGRVPNPVPNTKVISGVKYRQPAVVIDNNQ
jgi:hypothetical protein